LLAFWRDLGHIHPHQRLAKHDLPPLNLLAKTEHNLRKIFTDLRMMRTPTAVSR